MRYYYLFIFHVYMRVLLFDVVFYFVFVVVVFFFFLLKYIGSVTYLG